MLKFSKKNIKQAFNEKKINEKRNYFVSVAMTTYNGEKYIKEQMESVIRNLKEQDEIIVSDDGSTDNTVKIIESFNDNRIKIYKNSHLGFKKNYEFCISKCTGKYIFLCDQDDIWMENKVDTILKYFEEKKCDCVTHDAYVVGEDGNTILEESFLQTKFLPKPGIISNIIQSKYYGCLMAFNSELLKYVLPIPESIVSHDYWIGIMADKHGKSILVKDKLIKYRRHSSNTSPWKNHMKFTKMLNKRINIFMNVLKR